MAAQHDIQRGLIADFKGDSNAAAEVCRRASAQFKNSGMEVTGNRITVTIRLQSIGQVVINSDKSRRSVVAVALRQDGGKVHLETKLEHWTTTQSKMTVIPWVLAIPAGPKQLWGKEAIFRFYDNLETEIRAIDPQARVTRREPQR